MHGYQACMGTKVALAMQLALSLALAGGAEREGREAVSTSPNLLSIKYLTWVMALEYSSRALALRAPSTVPDDRRLWLRQMRDKGGTFSAKKRRVILTKKEYHIHSHIHSTVTARGYSTWLSASAAMVTLTSVRYLKRSSTRRRDPAVSASSSDTEVSGGGFPSRTGSNVGSLPQCKQGARGWTGGEKRTKGAR